MENPTEDLLTILREEYGITNTQDLEKAITRLDLIDLYPFCGELQRREKEGAL